MKELLLDLDAAAEEALATVRRSALTAMLCALRKFALDSAAERQARGRASFHDLLVWARNLLRDNSEARDHFRQRFSHLLIDEAQDTDPLQAEIAMFIAEGRPRGRCGYADRFMAGGDPKAGQAVRGR